MSEQGYSSTEVGWHEFIAPTTATTHVVYVGEDGSQYFPEGMQVCDSLDFRQAVASGRAWRVVREDTARADERARVLAEPWEVTNAEMEAGARKVNELGYTCRYGTHEPGGYDTCPACKEAADTIARTVLEAVRGARK